MKESKHIVGVDIGGSHITAAIISMEDGSILPESFVRQHIDSMQPAETILDLWAEAIQSCIATNEAPIQGVGFAMPGPFDYKNGISYMKNQGKYDQLYGIRVKEELSKRLDMPIAQLKFENDAVCFLKGEIFVDDALQQVRIVGLTLGTGLGTVVARDNEVCDVEWWDIPFNDSIAEEYISSRWFVKRYEELTGQQVANVKHMVEVGEDTFVQKVFDEFGDNLAKFLKKIIASYDAEQVILAGNIAKAIDRYKDRLTGIELPIKLSFLGERAALIGAVADFKSSF